MLIFDINYVNNKISKEICYDVIEQLKDNNLLNEYKINKLTIILDKYIEEKIKKELIISEYLLDLIPAGTKRVIRGNKFNDIVKNIIENMKLNKKRFEICFEKQCEISITTEKPDWYILEKQTNKVIIGMNQLDLWSGGQQLNRGSKYLINNKTNTEKSKLLCVICNEIKFISNKNKTYKLFEIGFSNDTLCYIKNIQNIVNTYFTVRDIISDT